MQIEKFDTGLKGQENFEKLNITPEENFNNKNLVRSYLNSIINDGVSKLEANLDKSFSKDIKVNCFHPCLLYTSPSPRDGLLSRMPSSA